MNHQWLVDAYRAMVPVKQILETIKTRYGDNDEWSSLEFQNAVMEYVVHDSICDKYSPHPSYIYRFLKQYMTEIEARNSEISDTLVEELMEFVAGPRKHTLVIDADDVHYVTYRIPTPLVKESFTVTCRVSSITNEVGLKIWEAGWFLAEYVLSHHEVFAGRAVLELGAGVGISGLILAKANASVQELIMSDYAPKVLLNLRHNVEINAPYPCPNVQVECIDWETWKIPTKRQCPHILLAGDCVYDIQAFPALIRVLQVFLRHPEDSKEPRMAIFAATIRNQTTFQTFLDGLHMHNINYQDITSNALEKMPPIPLFPYNKDLRNSIRLCKLY